MGTFEDIFGNYFNAYKNTSKYKDDSMLDIGLRKSEFEKNLDEMWDNYRKDALSRSLSIKRVSIKSNKLVSRF